MAASWRSAGLVLGVGVGGFIDGIVAHQLLEWHHMLSGWYPMTAGEHLRVNMVGDALFHLFSLVVVLVGIGLLAAAAPAAPPRRLRRLTGWMLAGWGGFNLVEGLVDHQLLGLHHVRSGPDELVYDIGFLALGAVLVAVGTWLGRSHPDSGRDARPAGATVNRADLRSLLDSDRPDSALVLHEGRLEVVAGAERERAGLEVVSRSELLRRTGTDNVTDGELDRQAAQLSAAVNTLGA